MNDPSVKKLWDEASGLADYFSRRQINDNYSVVVFCLMLKEITRNRSIEEKLTMEAMLHDALFPKTEQN